MTYWYSSDMNSRVSKLTAAFSPTFASGAAAMLTVAIHLVVFACSQQYLHVFPPLQLQKSLPPLVQKL